MEFDVFGMGNALVDMEFAVDDAFLETHGIAKGLMTLVDTERQFAVLQALRGQHGSRACGGSAANTMVAVAALGGRACYAFLVAADEMGDFFLEDLARMGVATTLQGPRPAGSTGSCVVLVTPDAERTMNTYLGISAQLSPAQLDEEAVARSRFVYVEGYLVSSPTARAAAVAAMAMARRHGVRTALSFSDPAMVQYFRLGLEEILGEGVDLLFCNRAEALAWAGCRTLAKAVDSLRQVAGAFAVTLGAEGALLFDGYQLHEVDPCPVVAKDTNGAGDMFAGAFLYGITHGMSFPEAGRLASLAASRVVTRFGPRLAQEEYAALLKDFRAGEMPSTS